MKLIFLQLIGFLCVTAQSVWLLQKILPDLHNRSQLVSSSVSSIGEASKTLDFW